ncbi:MAG: hypothetical protein NT069_12540, partial [Planctomycetota bacterium]|nr:hypothetical protein [Planctomycetota bacterium]
MTAYDANYEGEPLDSLGIPADVRAKFEQHFGVLNSKVVDKSGGLPDVAGEFVAAARAVKADGSLPEIPVTPQPPAQRWKVRFVDAATGQPVSRVLMTLTRSKTDGSQKSFVTRVVWDERTLDPELDADEFGFLTISDEALAAAEEGGRFFGNVPADVSAVEKHTNPNAPFIVKVKTREKTAAVDPGAAPQLPKLPDEAYTRPAVHSQKFREEDAKRPGGELMGAVLEPSKPADRDREPLVLGVRTASDAQWRIGGTAKVGLVVRNRTGGIGRNPPGRDVKFSYTGRLDNGLSVVAVDEAGKEHGATIAQFDSLLGFQQMLLPVAHVVTIKEFTLRFDAEKRDVSEPHVAAFHLPPGKYKLRCKWNDARPEVAHEGEWTGELVNEELEFTLAAAAEPATGEPNSGASAPQATATEKPKTTATESQPKTTAKEPFTAWGEEVGGLQAGLGFKVGEKRVYRHGETVTLVVRVRNVGNKNVKFQYYPTFLSENSPTVLDETGKRVSLRGNVLRLVHHDVPKQVNLAVGKEIELYERELRLAKGNEEADELKTRDIFPTGKFLIQHEQVIGNSAQASDKLDPTLEKLATGKLEFEVREPFTAWGEEVGGLQAGLGFKAGGKRAFSHGEKVTLVVRVRNVGKDEARFDYISEHFIENPPTVLDEKAMAVPLARGLVDTGVQVAREANLAPGKEIELAELTLEFSSRNAAGAGFPKSLTIYGTGKFQVAFEKVLGTGFVKLDPALGKLATGKLELEVTSPEKLPPEKETPTGPSNTAAEPAKPNPNYVTVVGRLLDDETGQPIEKAGWEWGMADPRKPDQISWGHSRSMGGSHPDGKFEMLLNIGANGHHYPLRVYSAGYETTVVVDELAKPYPQKIERNVRLKRGRSITGVLRDHTGNPVANGWVFFIPKGHQTNIVESVPGTDAHQLPANARDGAVSEVRTNENGTFALSTGVAGTLAASTDLVDLWPFPLPVDGYAELKMPAPSYLVIDLTYWYLDELAQKEKRVISPNSEDPNQCWIQVDQSGSSEPLWKNLGYRRQMLVFAKDPRAKLSKGVIVGHVVEWEMEKPIPDVGHNKNLSTKVRVALPPGNYRVQRLRTGPFAPVDEQNVELKSGEDTILSWARGDGSSVRGKANWPANMMFVRQPGEAPRKLDWTVPSTATVWIAPVGADGKDGKPIDAAKIQADGSFFVPTNLDPGKYKATARVSLPESDDSRRFRGYRGPDCIANAEFTVPDPARGPFGSPPVELEIKMEVAENVRFLRANAPADPPQAVQPPAGKAEELFTAWGKEVGGLQAGLGFKAGAKRAYRHGETVKVVLRVRNVGKEAVGFKHIWAFFVENPPTITDADGKLVRLPGPAAEGEHEPHSTDVAPGKEVELYEWKFDLRPKGESSKKKWSTIHGVGKFSLHLEQVVGPTLFNPNHPNPVLSKLATGKLELEIQPVALVQQETPKPKPGTMLKPATEQKLKWGEPVNGLRMALAWPPTLGEPGLGDTPEFYLVVQNVSEMGVRLTANDAAPNPRMLNLFDATIVSRTVDEVPIPGDWLLQPH